MINLTALTLFLRRVPKKTAFLILAISLTFCLQGSADAAYSSLSNRQPVDDHQYINITDGVTGNGFGSGASLPDSYLKIYAQGSQDRTVNVSLVDRGVGAGKACTGYKINLIWHKLYSDEEVDFSGEPGSAAPGTQLPTLIAGTSTQRPTYQWNEIDTSSYGLCPFTYQFIIPAANMTASNVPGHAGLYVGELQFVICSTTKPGVCTDDDHTGTFHVSIDGGAKIGFKGGQLATIYPSKIGATPPAYDPTWPHSAPYNDNDLEDFGYQAPPGGINEYTTNHTMRMEFRVPCDYSNTQTLPIWRDDDQRQNNQQRSIKLALNGVAIPDTDAEWESQSGVQGSYLISGVTPGQRYGMNFEKVWGGNGIAFNYPFDSADFELPCPVPSTANASCSSISVSLPDNNSHWVKIWVNNAGSGTGPPDTPDFEGARNASFVYDLYEERKIVGGGAALGWSVEVYPGATATSGIPAQYTGNVLNCFKAECSFGNFADVPGALGNSGAVKAKNGQLSVPVIIKNTGENDIQNLFPANPSAPSHHYLKAQVVGDARFYSSGDPPEFVTSLSGPLYKGASTVIYVLVNLNGGISDGTLDIFPIYSDYMRLGPLCWTPLDTFVEFDHDLSAGHTAYPDEENPTTIDMTTVVDQTLPTNSDPTIPGTATRKLVVKRIAGDEDDVLFGPYAHNQRYGDRTWSNERAYTDNSPLTREFAAGDQICPEIYLDNAKGWIGAGDVMYDVTSKTSPPACERIVDRPFVRSYMGDVTAGGKFVNTTTDSGIGAIGGYTRGTFGEIGSGVEFAAEAMNTITGFSSAFLRSPGNDPASKVGLSFAKDQLSAPCSASVPGCFRGSREVYNYFEGDMKPETLLAGSVNPGPQINLNAIENGPNRGKQFWFSSSSVTELKNTDAGIYASRNEVFVDGDLFISDSIIYPDDAWNNPLDIPNFRLIVRGNIYISNSVGQLDGLYVAQPKADGSSGGHIYTCVNPATRNEFASADHYNSCRSKLEVNGAFVAQEVHFLRTIYTLSSVQAGCPAPRPRENFGCDHAAESFRLSPDYFLGIPASKSSGSNSSGRFQDIKTLPPIL